MNPRPEIVVETTAARNGVVIRDITHYTRLLFSGPDHLDLLHRLTTNHFLDLPSGEGFEAVFPDNRGRIVSCGSFTRLDPDTTLLVIPSSSGERLVEWLDRYIFHEEVSIQDLTPKTAAIDVIGPESVDVLSGACPALDSGGGPIPPHRLISTGGKEPCLVGVHYGRLTGVRVIGNSAGLESTLSRLHAAGAVQLSDNGFEIIRIEEGCPALERELTEEHNPWEAGLDRAIHLDKGCYLGQEVIARLDTYDKVKQRLVGLRMKAAGPTGGSSRLVSREGRIAGKITSSVLSPTLASPIALAYVRNQFCAPGTELALEEDEGPPSPVTVSELPFQV